MTKWECLYEELGGVVGAEVGFDTQKIIIRSCRQEAIAARLCNHLKLNREDWFLHSVGELNLIYRNLYLNEHSAFQELH